MRSLRFAALSALVLCTGLAAMAPARANLVTNGDFETYDALSIPSWTVAGNANMGTANDVFLMGLPHSGTFAAWLGTPNSDGFLSQGITTTANEKYTISYWLAVDSADGAPTPNDFSTAFGGTTLFSGKNLTATDSHVDPAADYTQYTFTAVASSPTSTLQFGFRDDTSEFRLDDVSVVDAGPVPEASTTVSFGLLALGLGGVVIAKKRKQTA